MQPTLAQIINSSDRSTYDRRNGCAASRAARAAAILWPASALRRATASWQVHPLARLFRRRPRGPPRKASVLGRPRPGSAAAPSTAAAVPPPWRHPAPSGKNTRWTSGKPRTEALVTQLSERANSTASR
eukprot:358374-Chlamydomonas_euryale.AAC.6